MMPVNKTEFRRHLADPVATVSLAESQAPYLGQNPN